MRLKSENTVYRDEDLQIFDDQILWSLGTKTQYFTYNIFVLFKVKYRKNASEHQRVKGSNFVSKRKMAIL